MKKYLIIVFTFCQSIILFGQQQNLHYVDSLELVLKIVKDEDKKFHILNELSRFSLKSDYKKSLAYFKKANAMLSHLKDSSYYGDFEMTTALHLQFSGEADSAEMAYLRAIPLLINENRKPALSVCYKELAGLNFDKGLFQQAIPWFKKSTEIALQTKNFRLICINTMYMGVSLSQSGNRPEGLVELQKALKMAEKNGFNDRIGAILMFIGSTYSESSNAEYALNYFQKARTIAIESRDTLLLVEADLYIGNNYYYSKKYRDAIAVYQQVCEIANARGELAVYAGSLGNLGNVYNDMGDYQKGLDLQLASVKIFEQLQDNPGLSICYSAIGEGYYNLKQYQKALTYLQQALAIAIAIDSKEDLIEIHLRLSKTYAAINDFKNAYVNYKLYKENNDSVYNQENTKKLTELELNFRFQAQQKEQDLKQKGIDALADEKLKRQKLLSYSAILGIVLLMLLVGFVFRSNRQRKLANIKLQEYNQEVLLQKEVIEVKNKEITDSINYAKLIQESILPIRTEIHSAFPQSFVFFKPRDVVSGDFYWFAEKGNKKIIACVDCTGHGVPGAFMSMIGNTLLNEIVNEKGITTPSEILNVLHERVRQSLKQDLANSETRDGMDIAICSFYDNNTKLEYSGANRPLYYLRDNQLMEIKATKQPIGGDKMEEDRKFTNHKLNLKSNDSIYLLTDGYADQFGGDKGKKFMVKRFHQTLLDIQSIPMSGQGIELKHIIELWRGNIEQVDDILVMGIKIV